MPIVLDGNNFLHSLPTHERSRESVRRRALDAVRDGGMKLTVVFDGPPPEGASNPERLGSLTIRYSGATSADEIIIGLLPPSRASEWVVITDDRALGARVRGRGGRVRPLSEWRTRRPDRRRRPVQEPRLSSREIADWEEFFSSEEPSESA